MGLIEDAKRLSDGYLDPMDRNDECELCGLVISHADDCPWLAMPQIVKALEAAQAVVWEDCCRLACCNGGLHDDECPIPALRRALAGGQ